MKKVKNLVALFAIVIGSLSATQAQNINAGANIGLALPTGTSNLLLDPGFSWNIFGYYHFSDQVSAGLEIGGSSFSGPLFLGQSLDLTYTEMLAVGNFVFLNNDGLRLGGGIGAGFFIGEGSSDPGISPRFFAEYMVSDNIGLHAQLPFNMLLTGGDGEFNYFVFRVGGFYRVDM